MMEVPDHVREAAARGPSRKDKLDRLRQFAADARDAERAIRDLEERLSAQRATLSKMLEEVLPEMMDAAGVASIELEADGNSPGVKFSLSPYYSAGIAASWPDDKKREAFAYLESVGAADLIKTFVTLSFPKEDRARAVEVARELEGRGLDVESEETVHASTLKSWLRETIEGGEMPQLDKIGGRVGRKVIIKEVNKREIK